MKLLIIRHGDPDYDIDGLTEKGKREAQLLADWLENVQMDYIYQSPLGRAKKTASYTLRSKNQKAVTLNWLQEFRGWIKRPDGSNNCCWDRWPSSFTEDDIYYTSRWYDGSLFRNTNVRKEYDAVCKKLDALLEKHGYRHVGRHFEVIKENHDCIALFCHFGVESVLLSHLLGISPMVLWHNSCALTTSVTTLYTEEREKGYAIFRMSGFSEVGHLTAAGEAPSFQARFCECYSDHTRHE